MRPVRSTITATIVTAAIASSYVAAQASSATSASPGDTTRVLVQFRPTVTASDRAAAISRLGATDVGTVRDLGVHVLQVASAAADNVVAALSHRSDVEYAEPDATTQATQTPNDPQWNIEWGPQLIKAPTVWDSTTGSSSVVIAELDTGVDSSQPDLQGRFVAGYDFVGNDSSPADDNGHGTSVAGVIGATANNRVGMAGMCWSCQIMPVKVLDSAGSGDYATLANGITWATDHGAQVISMSLSGTSDSSTLHNAVTYAHNHGVVLVAAAGNSGTSAANYPAAYGEVLGVAGSQNNDTLYSWSNYGSWVKVAAPGCNEATVMGGGYGNFCGTSSATPLVAGLVGLLRSASPSATNTDVEAAVESSTAKIGSAVTYGRVDAAAALAALASGSASSGGTTSGTQATATSTFSGSLNGKNASKSYTVSSGAGTLTASATFSGASNLTLSVVNSSGQTVASKSGGSPVSLSSTVTAGTYKVVLSGAKASFTLTVTNPTP